MSEHHSSGDGTIAIVAIQNAVGTDFRVYENENASAAETGSKGSWRNDREKLLSVPPFESGHKQAALNPAAERKVERFGWTFAAGDKIMQIENDYDKEVYNGDIGFVEDVDLNGGKLTVTLPWSFR